MSVHIYPSKIDSVSIQVKSHHATQQYGTHYTMSERLLDLRSSLPDFFPFFFIIIVFPFLLLFS